MLAKSINGNYDSIEQSFFEAQDDMLNEDRALRDTSGEDAVDSFFGAPVPQPLQPPTAPAPQQQPAPPAQESQQP